MTNSVISQKFPYVAEVSAGKTYFWCRRGLSKNRLFCDGSHKKAVFSPGKYTSNNDGKFPFFGCKQTMSQPLYDGNHSKL